jgi:predicted component of type VI protein secretion system
MTIKEQRLFVLLAMLATLLCGLLGCQSSQPVAKSVNINPVTATATLNSGPAPAVNSGG